MAKVRDIALVDDPLACPSNHSPPLPLHPWTRPPLVQPSRRQIPTEPDTDSGAEDTDTETESEGDDDEEDTVRNDVYTLCEAQARLVEGFQVVEKTGAKCIMCAHVC